MPNGHIDGAEAPKQADEADDRDDQRADVQGAPRGWQAEREGDEHLTEAERNPLPQRQPGKSLAVEAAAEEVVGVRRVVREEPPQIALARSRECRCRTTRERGPTPSFSTP